jgi:hypothetical protein
MMSVPVRLVAGTAKVSARTAYVSARTAALVGAKTVAASTTAAYVAGRAVGSRNAVVFGAGVTVGVLVGSPRARAGVARIGSTLWAIRERNKGPSDAEITEQVRRRLAGAQATWNLPQPEVTVVDGRVRLDGEAPDADALRAIAETASEVDGAREVDTRIVVAVDRGDGESGDGGERAAMTDDDDVTGAGVGGNGSSARSAGAGTADAA